MIFSRSIACICKTILGSIFRYHCTNTNHRIFFLSITYSGLLIFPKFNRETHLKEP